MKIIGKLKKTSTLFCANLFLSISPISQVSWFSHSSFSPERSVSSALTALLEKFIQPSKLTKKSRSESLIYCFCIVLSPFYPQKKLFVKFCTATGQTKNELNRTFNNMMHWWIKSLISNWLDFKKKKENKTKIKKIFIYFYFLTLKWLSASKIVYFHFS